MLPIKMAQSIGYHTSLSAIISLFTKCHGESPSTNVYTFYQSIKCVCDQTLFPCIKLRATRYKYEFRSCVIQSAKESRSRQ